MTMGHAMIWDIFGYVVYKDNTQILGHLNWSLTFPILRSSKIASNGPICMN